MKAEWQTERLGAISKRITDGSHNPPKGVPSSDYLMLSSKNIFDDCITYNAPRFLSTEHFAQEDKRTGIEAGDVLLTIVGTVGRAAVVPSDAPKLTLQRSVAVIRPNKDILQPRFLMYSFMSRNAELNGQARGVAQKGIYLETLRELEIQYPPISEQQRIVGILDEAFDGIATAIANAEKNLQNARALFESYLQAVFTQQGEGWMEKTLANVADANCSLSYGIVQPGDEYPDGLPVVRPTDLTKKIIRPEGLKRINPALAASYRRTTLAGGELLLCVRGTTGMVCVASEELLGANVTRGIVPITFNSSYITQEFGYYILTSDIVQTQIRKKTYGAALMQINIRDLRGISLPFPSLQEQRFIAEKLDAIDAETQRLESIYQQKLAALDELKKALLHQAFNGEL